MNNASSRQKIERRHKKDNGFITLWDKYDRGLISMKKHVHATNWNSESSHRIAYYDSD